MSVLETKPLSDIGVEIIGLDLGAPIGEDIRQALEDIFIEWGIVLFRDSGGSVEAQLNLSRCFGSCMPNPLKELWAEGHPELTELVYRPVESGLPLSPVYQVGEQARAGWQPWHADLYYTSQINRGGILRAVVVPDEGGKTGFIDRIRLYETLPERLKTRIETLSLIYKLDLDFSVQKYGMPDDLKLLAFSQAANNIMARVERDFPAVVHPMVYRQAKTGRKVLNVSPLFTVGIEGMESEEGEDLLAEIIEHCVTSPHVYLHDWAENDMMLWDNWRTLHSAEGVPVDCTRRMQRTTIKGDYALGRSLAH